MKSSKILCCAAALLIAVTVASCSDDDENGIYFVTDEVVEGDILTGKEVSVKSINVYKGYSYGCQVRGFSGTLQAVSSDESVATAEINATSDATYLAVRGCGEGSTVITVSDAAGQIATMPVSVKPLNRYKYERTDASNDFIGVEGVSDSEAEAIKSDVRKRFADEFRYELEPVPTMPSAGLYRLYVYDKSGNLLYEMHGSKQFHDSSFVFQKTDGETKYAYFFGSEALEIYLTDLYRMEYPNVKTVVFVMNISKIE